MNNKDIILNVLKEDISTLSAVSLAVTATSLASSLGKAIFGKKKKKKKVAVNQNEIPNNN